MALTSELLSCKGCSIAPGRAPSCLAWDLGPTRSPTRWAARAGKLGSAGIPGRWLEVEPSTRHPRPSGCRSWRRHLLASLWNFYLPSPNAMSPGEARPGAQKSCEQCLSEHPPSRAGTAQPPGRLPPLPTTSTAPQLHKDRGTACLHHMSSSTGEGSISFPFSR